MFLLYSHLVYIESKTGASAVPLAAESATVGSNDGQKSHIALILTVMIKLDCIGRVERAPVYDICLYASETRLIPTGLQILRDQYASKKQLTGMMCLQD